LINNMNKCKHCGIELTILPELEPKDVCFSCWISKEIYSKINPDNWFWCDLCKCISYDYHCECGSTLCNGTGCEKCAHLQHIVELAREKGLAPSKEELVENKCIPIPEIELLREIFEEEQKKVEQKPYEFDLTWDSKYNCPVCKKTIKAITIYEMGKKKFKLVPCECWSKVHTLNYYWYHPN